MTFDSTTNLLASAMTAAVFVLAACEATSIAGPAGRRARMVDEQLQAVLERDFPVGTSRAAVRARATELGMQQVASRPPEEVVEGQAESGGGAEAFSFSFAPDTGWGVTRVVRIEYGPADRVERVVLVPRMRADTGALPVDEPGTGWIRVEGAP
jgi:hypothetical protein